MKKIILLLILILQLTGCDTPMVNRITDEKFDDKLNIEKFDVKKYILSIEDKLSSINYIRMDSIQSDSDNESIKVEVSERILIIFDEYKNHSTYELVNFLDMHIKKMIKLEIDILLQKIITRIENDLEKQQKLINNIKFDILTEDISNRITNLFLKNYEITDEIKNSYPEFEEYILDLKFIINGGYQIRKFNGKYEVYPDYSSILIRYDDYYSDEAMKCVDIFLRESRSIVKIGGVIQADNEAIAYKINLIEEFLDVYKNSMYHDLVKNLYIEHLSTIITNEKNIKNGRYTKSFKISLNKIINRYEKTEMARILSNFSDSFQKHNGIYNLEEVNNAIIDIKESY